eukprot:gene15169-15310_t
MVPRLLNYIVAAFLIVSGIIGLGLIRRSQMPNAAPEQRADHKSDTSFATAFISLACLLFYLISGLFWSESALALNRETIIPPGMTPVTDQGDTLQCWAVAITSRMDFAASRRAGFPLKLSSKYLLYAKTKAEVVYKIVSGNFSLFDGGLCEGCTSEPVYYIQGGTLADAVETVKITGIMPEVAYPGFPKEDETLFRQLNELFKTYASDPSLPRNVANVSAKVSAILDSNLGVPPESFEFKGKTYTPQSYLTAFLPSWQHAGAVELNYWPGHARIKTVEKAFNGKSYVSYWTGNQTDIIQVLNITLAAHRSALIGSWYLESAYQRDKIGFHINGIAPPHHFNWNNPDQLDHYMLVLAAKHDRNYRQSGKHSIDRLYVKNTFGVTAKEGYGFNWMEKDYFPFILSVEINDHLIGKLTSNGLLAP